LVKGEGFVLSYGDVIGTVGVGVSIAGFAFALDQLRKTTDATEAANESLKSATSQLARNHLLVLLTQFETVEGEFSKAVSSTQIPLVTDSLTRFSHLTIRVASLLGGVDDLNAKEDQILQLHTSALVARDCRDILMMGTSKPLDKVIKNAARHIGNTSALVIELITNYSYSTKGN
jgi:ClpP class serine protease